jgi:uncharacterized protein YcbK (DUF882 family)
LQLGFGALVGAGFSAGLGLPALAQAAAGPMAADGVADSKIAGKTPSVGKDAAPRSLAIHNLHTGEKLEALYYDKGAYVPDALLAVNKLMRDHRNGQQHPIDPKLLDLLVAVRGQVEASSCYELICGYRSPATNAAMHAHSSQVASNSLHIQGMAADVRIGGVELQHLRNAALALRVGGVGLYPVSDFVHVDVGPVRRWSGT